MSPETVMTPSDRSSLSVMWGRTSAVIGFALAVSLCPGVTRGARVPAFPGAVGFGTETAGGRGGEIVVVTNLHDHGLGSFRDAVEDARGPRMVLFAVSGYVDLESAVTITHPDVTIAGQTAPPPGITLRYHDLRIHTHDVVVQHLRVRVGPGSRSNDRPDGIEIGDPNVEPVFNVVVDHCSVSWGVDKNIDLIFGSAHDITISNCIISEALRRSTHPKGAHSMGVLVGHRVQRVAFVRNVFAHNDARNPKFNSGTSGIFVNNIVYDVRNNPDIQNSHRSEEPILLTMEGNWLRPGQYDIDFTRHALLVQADMARGTRVFLRDNDCVECTGNWKDDVLYVGDPGTDVRSDDRPVWVEGVDVMPASHVLDGVLPEAGAFPRYRDLVDLRIADDVRNGTGRIIDCVTADTVETRWGNVLNVGRDFVTVRESRGRERMGSAYRDYVIVIVGGAGRGEVRRIVRCIPDSLKIYVQPDWAAAPQRPDANSVFTIVEPCENHAGGWPPLEARRRELTIPDHPHTVQASGYTALEEWVHTFSKGIQ